MTAKRSSASCSRNAPTTPTSGLRSATRARTPASRTLRWRRSTTRWPQRSGAASPRRSTAPGSSGAPSASTSGWSSTRTIGSPPRPDLRARVRSPGARLAWFAPDQHAAALERWPDLAEDLFNPARYARRIEEQLRTLHAALGHPLREDNGVAGKNPATSCAPGGPGMVGPMPAADRTIRMSFPRAVSGMFRKD